MARSEALNTCKEGVHFEFLQNRLPNSFQPCFSFMWRASHRDGRSDSPGAGSRFTGLFEPHVLMTATSGMTVSAIAR